MFGEDACFLLAIDVWPYYRIYSIDSKLLVAVLTSVNWTAEFELLCSH